MTINKTTDRTNTELFLNKDYKQLLINGELYKDIKIMDLHTDVDVKIIDVNLNSSDIEIGYELSYSFKLCSLDLGESNDTIHGNHNDEFDDSKWTKTPTAIIKGSWHESIKKE